MQDFMAKARPMRSVFRRTRARDGLPALVLYVEWLSGARQRRVLDPDGVVHLLDDTTVQSHYRAVTGAQAKGHIADHWQAQVDAALATPAAAPPA